jgi:putative ABC transport system substrate-binding protein
VPRVGVLRLDACPEAVDQRAAVFVDRLLKGTRPEDLPVEQPRQFDLVVNLATARRLGLTVPRPVLLGASEVSQ